MLVIYHKPQNSYIINTDFTLIQSHQPRTFKQCLPKVGLQFQFMFSIFYRCKPKGLSYELISVELALNNTLNPEGYVSNTDSPLNTGHLHFETFFKVLSLSKSISVE